MRWRGLAVPAAVAVSVSLPAQSPILPSLADLTIRTTRHADPPDSTVFTDVLYVKGARWRHEHIVDVPDPAATRHVTARLVQCDRGRDVGLFPTSQTYIESPIIPQPDGRPATLKIPQRVDPPAVSGPIVTITLETVDTGERRQVGSLVARRVITTRTTTPSPGASTLASVETTDGWYVDVFRRCADDPWDGRHVLVAINPGQPMNQPRFVLRGEPERGYPIETTWRLTSHAHAIGSTTSLIELSEVPLDQAIFDIPTAYRPALPLPGGGFDPSKPDSIGNRVESYWTWMTSWVSYWLI